MPEIDLTANRVPKQQTNQTKTKQNKLIADQRSTINHKTTLSYNIFEIFKFDVFTEEKRTDVSCLVYSIPHSTQYHVEYEKRKEEK